MRFKHLRRQIKGDYDTGRFLAYQRAKVKAGRVSENDLREVYMPCEPPHWPPLLDAAGREIPTDTCVCGRPKLRAKRHCCDGCIRPGPMRAHSPTCTMRCAALGLPTPYAIRATDARNIPGTPIPFLPNR